MIRVLERLCNYMKQPCRHWLLYLWPVQKLQRVSCMTLVLWIIVVTKSRGWYRWQCIHTCKIYRNHVIVNYTCASHLLHGCKQTYISRERQTLLQSVLSRWMARYSVFTDSSNSFPDSGLITSIDFWRNVSASFLFILDVGNMRNEQKFPVNMSISTDPTFYIFDGRCVHCM